MNKLKQILEFIRALLGFLLNLKKKKTDEKNEKPPRPIPGKLPDDVPDDTPSDSIGIVSGRPRDNGPVGEPFGGGAGMYRSPLDTLGVWTNGTGQASSFVGWALIAYATGMSLWGAGTGVSGWTLYGPCRRCGRCSNPWQGPPYIRRRVASSVSLSPGCLPRCRLRACYRPEHSRRRSCYHRR